MIKEPKLARKPPFLNLYRDRHGTLRLYYRCPGRPRVPMPLPLYSEAFWLAYHAAEAAAQADAQAGAAGTAGTLPAVTEGAKVGQARPGSMSALIEAYYHSAEWRSLAAGSRETYRRQLEHFRQEFGAAMVAQFTTKHANLLMDRLADRPAAANNLRDRLNVLMKFAISIGMREDNPIKLSKRVKHRSKGYRTWSEEDIARFQKRWPLGTPQRLAMEVPLNTGLRRSDAVRLGRQHVTPDGQAFILTTVKSQGRTELYIPILSTLRPALAAVPADQLTYIVTAYGAARSGKALTNWLKEAACAAGLPPDSSPHGLRKAACRRLAEAGCTPHQIMSITGHQALKEIETYTREASRKLLAQQAMGRLVSAFPGAGPAGGQQTENTSLSKVTTRPDEVVNLDHQPPGKID